MINQKQKVLLLIILVLGSLLLLWQFKQKKLGKAPTPKAQVTSEATPLPQIINAEERTLNGKKVVGLTPGKEKEELKDLQVANEVSSNWREETKAALVAQGGSALQNVEIKPVESFIWIHEGVALNVESTIVTLTDENGRETIFRALVDAQSGKILKSWDQPINDPVNPREQMGIKIDPRYHPEN